MSKVIKRAYGEEMEKGYNLRTAMEEASRCLLCHDAPCSKSCPAGTDPAKFIRSLRFRNIKGAAETIRENNPLAGCCAEVCPYGQLCEQGCSRSGIDKPINIGKLQKFIVEQEKEQGMEFLKKEAAKPEKIACVGAGPASLSCARELALKGYGVTIYEAQEKAGGVLTYGIIPSRLSQEIVDFDIQTIEKLGVTFKFNETIDAAKLECLKAQYDAVFVGTGLWKSKIVDIPGKELDGVVSAIEFLKDARTNAEKMNLGKTVLVIGGGDVAMDCVTTAKQLGAKATIVYRRTVEEAPADIAEVSAVQAMGIPIIQEFAPAEILGENGHVTAMKFAGRDGESELTMKADQVVFAIGQTADDTTADITESDKVFTGGDMVNGGKTVVQAVADGKIAAIKIAECLNK
jgi:dihydropyrimidine dehydrogenase (NAD+) subunit PreT